MKRECKTCEWWLLSTKGIGDCGECRKNAPSPVMEEDKPVWWPNVDDDDWCGEYQERIEDGDMEDDDISKWEPADKAVLTKSTVCESAPMRISLFPGSNYNLIVDGKVVGEIVLGEEGE